MSDILNCGQAKQESELVRFSYQCSKYWQNLQVTEDVIVHSPLRKSKRKLGQSAIAMSIH